jgi:hypothetical protein
VPLASALGEHRDPQHMLKIPPHHKRIVASADHWDLLSRENVYAQLRAWLTDDGDLLVAAREVTLDRRAMVPIEHSVAGDAIP